MPTVPIRPEVQVRLGGIEFWAHCNDDNAIRGPTLEDAGDGNRCSARVCLPARSDRELDGPSWVEGLVVKGKGSRLERRK